MSTTVRVLDEDKARIQRLQEAWLRARGARPSQQEILGRGLEYLERHEDAFLAEAAWTPLTATGLAALRALQGRFGRGASDRVDDVVYGGQA